MNLITIRLESILNDIVEKSQQITHSHTPTLIAVSKTKPVADVLTAWQAGQRHFGENKVQEAQKKFLPLREQQLDFTLHLIGPLQTNKVADAVALFDVIHTLDRLKLAQALQKEMHKQQRYPDLLVQVNTGKELQKAGVFPEQTVAFVKDCWSMNLPVKGLMCIPPVDDDPHPHFAILLNLKQQCGLQELSMGMSSDYQIAIEYGATYVRIGSAIFGDR